MSSRNLSTRQFPVIHESEARGNSRGVTHAEFQSLARAGRDHVRATEEGRHTKGMDAHWGHIKDQAYELAKQPWGGATINGRTGKMRGDTADEVDSKVGSNTGFGHGDYAITNRAPHEDVISIPTSARREEFHSAMDRAKEKYPQIGNSGGHLGVFHDVDKGSIDIDPVLMVHTPDEVEKVGAYTRAVGGAYHFQSGNGYFPPHVKSQR